MAYNGTFPADDSFLADFPAGMREQLRAVIQDALVNAGNVKGLTTGNASGNIPVANGNECANLNAAKLSGKTAGDFAPKAHAHNVATGSSDGYMSAAMVNKLNGVAAGAEVNQSAFSNVKVGAVTVQADAKQDVLELVAGTNIALTPDATNDRIQIDVSGKVGSAGYADSSGWATSAGNANNSAMVGGMAANTTGTNNQGNQIVRTDGNGYCNFGWINTPSGDMGTGGINRIYCSNDNFVRYKSVQNFKASLGLDQVNNTLDANKSVNYANIAGTAARLGRGGDVGQPMTFHWAGQNGQPPWLWGGSDGNNMYVYNPGNFNVNYANSAGSINWANIIGVPSSALGGIVAQQLAQNGYVKFATGLILQWGRIAVADTVTLTYPVQFTSGCWYFDSTILNPDSTYAADFDFQPITMSNSAIKLYLQNYSDVIWYRNNALWIALGA